MVIRNNEAEYILQKKFKNGNSVVIKYSKEVFKTNIYVNGALRKVKQFNYKGELTKAILL